MAKWQDVPQLKLIDWPKRLPAIGAFTRGCYIVTAVYYKNYKRAKERNNILHQMLNPVVCMCVCFAEKLE